MPINEEENWDAWHNFFEMKCEEGGVYWDVSIDEFLAARKEDHGQTFMGWLDYRIEQRRRDALLRVSEDGGPYIPGTAGG